MSIGVIAFIVLVFTTFVSNGVQLYIHFEAYPLIPFVGKSEFATYLKEYEGRLMVALVLPYLLSLVSNIVLFFTRPTNVTLVAVIIVFVVNIAVSVVTVVLATPIYNRIKQAGEAAPAEMAPLMRINLLRLLLSTLSSVMLIIVLLSVIPA